MPDAVPASISPARCAALVRAAPLRLGASACLLGQPVRYDGGHKRDGFLADVLGRYVEWVPVCPEVGVGMGTPREPVRLVGDPAGPRLVAARSGGDRTDEMRRWSATRVDELVALDLHGFVFMPRSPSCGLFRVKVFGDGDRLLHERGRGLFAAALTGRLPTLPVEESERLRDPRIREDFLERVLAYRLRDRAADGPGSTR